MGDLECIMFQKGPSGYPLNFNGDASGFFLIAKEMPFGFP